MRNYGRNNSDPTHNPSMLIGVNNILIQVIGAHEKNLQLRLFRGMEIRSIKILSKIQLTR